MSGSRIAVIVPVYNRPTVAVEALQGVLAQTRQPDRVVVVDDGSTDRTAETVQTWLAHDGAALNAELIRQANQGVAAARNHGAAAADVTGPSDVLAFLDSDDIWPSDYLQRADDTFAARPDVVAAVADRLNVNERTGWRECKSCQWVEVPDITARLFLQGPPGMSNTAYRAQAFHQTGGYDPDLMCGEDYHLHLRLSLLGPWAHLPGEPVTYRQHTSDAAEPGQQLSRRFDDRRLRIAQMLQRFIDEEGGAEAVAPKHRRWRLTRAWYAAGYRLYRIGRPAEARDCFERALQCSPWHMRARLRHLMLRGA